MTFINKSKSKKKKKRNELKQKNVYFTSKSWLNGFLYLFYFLWNLRCMSYECYYYMYVSSALFEIKDYASN